MTEIKSPEEIASKIACPCVDRDDCDCCMLAAEIAQVIHEERERHAALVRAAREYFVAMKTDPHRPLERNHAPLTVVLSNNLRALLASEPEETGGSNG